MTPKMVVKNGQNGARNGGVSRGERKVRRQQQELSGEEEKRKKASQHRLYMSTDATRGVASIDMQD